MVVAYAKQTVSVVNNHADIRCGYFGWERGPDIENGVYDDALFLTHQNLANSPNSVLNQATVDAPGVYNYTTGMSINGHWCAALSCAAY